MNMWQQLGITATRDVRAIKRAYAVRLKQTRPDEKPQEFQALHEAYQHALALARRNTETAQPAAMLHDTFGDADDRAESDAADPDNDMTMVVVEERPESPFGPHQSGPRQIDDSAKVAAMAASAGESISMAVVEERAESPPELRQPSPQQIEGRRLLDEVDAILADDIRRSRLESWRFLEKCPYLFDADFSWQLGLRIFKRIEHHYRTDKKFYINNGRICPILNYLSDLFGWRIHEASLRGALGNACCDMLWPMMDGEIAPVVNASAQGLRGSRGVRLVGKKNREGERLKLYYSAGLRGALLARIIDVLIFAIPVGWLINNVDERLPTSGPAFLLCLYFFAAWLFETSRMQATPGMYILGFKATDLNFKRLTYRLGFVRNATFLAICGVVWALPAVAEWINDVMLDGKAEGLAQFIVVAIIVLNLIFRGSPKERVFPWEVVDYRRSKREAEKKEAGAGN